ncbi:hypothetical protein LR48_Vigan04g027500 [Vigna angularis]|uniref:Uncharacterized protein n=1 Tax=Phaseolus angularis TaxID=3914 RepID=A0A0L9UC00_PHAAN|nr:hypothetical protein LR48_Vigan04g027500 [Vigna angularis]
MTVIDYNVMFDGDSRLQTLLGRRRHLKGERVAATSAEAETTEGSDLERWIWSGGSGSGAVDLADLKICMWSGGSACGAADLHLERLGPFLFPAKAAVRKQQRRRLSDSERVESLEEAPQAAAARRRAGGRRSTRRGKIGE